MRKRIYALPEWLDKIAIITGSCCFGFILLLLAGFKGDARRLSENSTLMIAIPVFLLVGGACYFFFQPERTRRFSFSALYLSVAYFLLFLLQILWTRQVYFYTGWDVDVMRNCAEGIIHGSSMANMGADRIYSIYPNNLPLFYLFCLIEKTGMLFSMEDPYLLCIYGSCLCVNFSCFLGNLIMRKLTESGFIRVCYFLVSTAYILFSPWIIIPYSDTYGMLFVMLGMWALICLDQKYLKWIVTAGAAVIGYQIKPTCLFPLFTAFLVYGPRCLLHIRRKWKELCTIILSTAFFWGICLLIPLWIQHTYSFRLIPELRIPYTHYLMMGFNSVSSGVFYNDDVVFSLSFPDVESRKAANLEEFRIRLESLKNSAALDDFLVAKAMVNFNDGTFAWTGEGDFFNTLIDHGNSAQALFQSIAYPPGVLDGCGEYYALFRTISHVVWLLILAGILLVIADSRSRSLEKACMMVTLCGLCAFLMLFEARARYLYLYSPVFLLLSLCGYEGVWKKLIPQSNHRNP